VSNECVQSRFWHVSAVGHCQFREQFQEHTLRAAPPSRPSAAQGTSGSPTTAASSACRGRKRMLRDRVGPGQRLTAEHVNPCCGAGWQARILGLRDCGLKEWLSQGVMRGRHQNQSQQRGRTVRVSVSSRSAASVAAAACRKPPSVPEGPSAACRHAHSNQLP